MTLNTPDQPNADAMYRDFKRILKIEPFPRQEDFLSLPDSVYEALYGGAAYGGKSFTLTMLPLFRGFYKYRGFKGILFRREMPDLEKEVIRLSKEYFPLTGAKYNENKHSWHWPEYNTYFDFSHIKHLNILKQKYDTAQFNYAAYDELTHFEEPMYIYIVGSRVRPSSSFNISFVRSGSNPGGIGQTFVYKRFVQPCETGYKLIRDGKTGLTRIFIPSFYQDNPYGLAYDPRYADKLEILPEAEKRAKKYGDWHAFEGSVFTSFRPIRFPDEPPNALHLCRPFIIPEWWPRILSIDWGKRAMCHAMWGAISPDDRLFIYRERSWKGADIPFWAAEVGQLSEYENIVTFVLCGSAWQEHGGESIRSQVHRYSGMKPITSENTPGSRITTLHLVQDFMRWEQKPRRELTEEYDHGKAQDIYRIYGEEALKRYVDAFKPYAEETNIPRLQILTNDRDESIAPILTETIPICVYDEKKKEDIKEFDGDDPIDNLRYMCKFAHRYMNGMVGEELERRKRVQTITEQYASAGNTAESVTRYYRAMEHIEAQREKDSFGVRRIVSRRYR